MPTMPRPKGKASKIAAAIFGKGKKRKSKKSAAIQQGNEPLSR
jgi:hypothetical protein